MSRPDSVHVTALKQFRERLVEARRAASRETDLDAALRRFVEIETAIGLVDGAIENEMDLTPVPPVDDPTKPGPFPDDENKGPPCSNNCEVRPWRERRSISLPYGKMHKP